MPAISRQWLARGSSGEESTAKSERRRLAQEFPKLKKARWGIKSRRDPAYNCIGWAAGDDTRTWWPGIAALGYYWPILEKKESVACFMKAFATLGYKEESTEDFEAGWEKVAIYANKYNTPTHMARQLSNGEWTSKLGMHGHDILHAAHDGLEGPEYGRVVKILKRRP